MSKTKLKCFKCDYEWIPRKNPKEIKECPRCKKRNWNKDYNQGKCQNCGRNFLILHEHHIIPKKEGGTDNKKNLMYVCTSCHRYLHNEKRNKRMS